MSNQQRVWLECRCTSFDHSIRVIVDRGDDIDEPFVSLELIVVPHTSFWVRFKKSFRYLFFGESIHVMETLLDEASIDTLIKAVTSYKIHKRLFENRQKRIQQ